MNTKFFSAVIIPCLVAWFSQSAIAQNGTWTATGSLNTAVYFHTATLLPNGKVLVAGGAIVSFPSAVVSASAELYDPASGTWTATGSLNTAHYQHTATLLPNGKVLVAAGHDSSFNPSASAELYDPASGTWAATGNVNTARDQHTATLLPNGKVLIAGGTDNGGSLASAELYDSASGIWTATGSLATARVGHTATLLPNGKVLAVGGYNGGYLTSAEVYDPASGTWAATGSLATARIGPTATLLPNGKVLAVGGYNGGYLTSAEVYDPASGTWSATGNLATARNSDTATLLLNGKVLVAGGFSGSSAFAGAELYDPASGTWTATGNLNTARDSHTATLLANGEVLVTGGNDDGGSGSSLASAELFDLPYSAQVQQPINADGTSVFNVRRGVVPVKFTLSQGGVATCALPPATIALTRTAGGTIGAIDELVYSGPADTGSNFRIDSCQYIYNLNASALGVGIYRVDIMINNQVVGSGVFQLK